MFAFDDVTLTTEGKKNLKDNDLFHGDSSRPLGMTCLCKHAFYCLGFSARRFLCFTAMLLIASVLLAQKSEGKHWGAEVEFMPGKALVMDEYQRKWMRGKDNYTIGVRANYSTLPSDSDDFAADYNYPTLSIGLRYSMNSNVTMYRDKDKDWPLIEPVDYESRLGNIVTLYGMFSRPIFRSQKWEFGYSLAAGVGYSKNKYNTHDAIDNELIGSRWLIYFGAGLNATYRFAPKWGLKAGLDFYHHSNGALNRPNKGANILGPSLALCYQPYAEEVADTKQTFSPASFKSFWYCNITAGIGGKTMLEDWIDTQFDTPPSETDYRTDQFKSYVAYSLQADIMCRYARRWASGAGVDLFYGTYSSHIRDLDAEKGRKAKHSPWSVGIAAKHQVYFRNLSLAMSVGYYLFREMGHNAKENEKRYYERIGIHYTFPSLGGLTIGGNVKAHLTKADLTEFVVSYPIKL